MGEGFIGQSRAVMSTLVTVNDSV